MSSKTTIFYDNNIHCYYDLSIDKSITIEFNQEDVSEVDIEEGYISFKMDSTVGKNLIKQMVNNKYNGVDFNG